MLSAKEKKLLIILEDSIKLADLNFNYEKVEKDFKTISQNVKTLSQYILISGIYNELREEENNVEIYFEIFRNILLADIYKYRGDSYVNYHKNLKYIFLKCLSIEALDLGLLTIEKLIKSASFHKDTKNKLYAKNSYNLISVKYKYIKIAESIYLNYLENKSCNKKKLNRYEFIYSVFNKLNKLYIKTNSIKIQSQLLLVKIDYCYNNDSLDQYLKASLEFYKFVKLNKHMFYKSKIFNAVINLAVAYVRNNKLDKAIDVINKCKIETLSEYNNSVLYYFKTYIDFYSSDKLNYSYILNNKINNIYKMKTYIIYLTSLYIGNKHKECFSKIINLNIIEDPQDYFHLYFRLLCIYIYIDLEMYDLASAQIENFRKYIERNNQMMDQVHRWILVKRVLVALSKSSFDFEKCYKKTRRYVDCLSSNDPKYRWVPFTSEVLPFNVWFLSKAKFDVSSFEYIDYFKNRL